MTVWPSLPDQTEIYHIAQPNLHPVALEKRRKNKGKGLRVKKPDAHMPKERRQQPSDRLAPDERENAPHFRARKRSRFTDFRFHLARSLEKLTVLDLLPMAIVIAGTGLAATLVDGGLQSAIITALTASLCLLSVFVSRAIGIVRKPSDRVMHNRFEELEDKAWELQESEERYRAIASVFGDALVLRDEAGTITFCNQAFGDLAGFENGSFKPGKKFPQALHDQLNRQAGKSGGKELEIKTNKGLCWFEWHDIPVRDEKSGGVGILSVARDITAFRQSRQLDEEARQKAEDASRAKSRFLAMVSHEMRTPLNGIIGMSKLLASTDLSPEQRNYSNALMTSGENLLGLIDGMLDLTVIEAGHFEIRLQQFNIQDLLNNAAELLSHRAYAKGIDCGLFIDPSVPDVILSDPGRLRQIIFNLAGNAVKFTDKGGVFIRCVMTQTAEGQRLRIEINDTGPGLHSDDREVIFEEFERVDNEITRTTEGAGLGLAISRALAREMGGILNLEKSDERGSSFVFEVPVEIADTGVGQENTAEYRLQDQCFLIISKAEQEPKALAETLGVEGADVRLVDTEKELKSLISKRADEFTDIFFDPAHWDRPFEMLTFLKQNKADTARIILLSLPEKKQELTSFMRNGADAWLVRPVRRASLMTLLQREKSSFRDINSMNFNQLDADTSHVVEDNTPTMITPEPSEVLKSGKVLLAEDNDINALLVTAALTKQNISVTRVVNGNEAVEKFFDSQSALRQDRFSLILMDMHMPQCDGYSATAAIRKLEKEASIDPQNHIRIFALTADEQNDSKERAMSAGVDGFLVKPIDPVNLCELVKRELEKGEGRDKITA